MLPREGKTSLRAHAKPMASIKTNAQICENAVNTKALARREPYPPAKSDEPQRKTAITEQIAGLNGTSDGINANTPHESTTAL
jgi:hypothetical protein